MHSSIEFVYKLLNSDKYKSICVCSESIYALLSYVLQRFNSHLIISDVPLFFQLDHIHKNTYLLEVSLEQPLNLVNLFKIIETINVLSYYSASTYTILNRKFYPTISYRLSKVLSFKLFVDRLEFLMQIASTFNLQRFFLFYRSNGIFRNEHNNPRSIYTFFNKVFDVVILVSKRSISISESLK